MQGRGERRSPSGGRGMTGTMAPSLNSMFLLHGEPCREAGSGLPVGAVHAARKRGASLRAAADGTRGGRKNARQRYAAFRSPGRPTARGPEPAWLNNDQRCLAVAGQSEAERLITAAPLRRHAAHHLGLSTVDATRTERNSPTRTTQSLRLRNPYATRRGYQDSRKAIERSGKQSRTWRASTRACVSSERKHSAISSSSEACICRSALLCGGVCARNRRMSP